MCVGMSREALNCTEVWTLIRGKLRKDVIWCNWAIHTSLIAATLNQFEPKRSNLCCTHVCPACLYIFQCIEELLPAQTVATEARSMRGCGNVATDWSIFWIFLICKAQSRPPHSLSSLIYVGARALPNYVPSHGHCKTALASSLYFSLGATTLKALNPCSLSNGQSAKFFIAFKPREKKNSYQELKPTGLLWVSSLWLTSKHNMLRFSPDSEPDEIWGTAEVLVRALAGPLAVSTNNKIIQDSIVNTQHLHRTVPLLLVVAIVIGHLNLSVILYLYLSCLSFSCHLTPCPGPEAKQFTSVRSSFSRFVAALPLVESCCSGRKLRVFGFRSSAPVPSICTIMSLLSTVAQGTRARCERVTAGKPEKNRKNSNSN